MQHALFRFNPRPVRQILQYLPKGWGLVAYRYEWLEVMVAPIPINLLLRALWLAWVWAVAPFPAAERTAMTRATKRHMDKLAELEHHRQTEMERTFNDRVEHRARLMLNLHLARQNTPPNSAVEARG